MNLTQQTALLEGVLFAAGEPVPLRRLAQALELPEEEAYKLLKKMQDKYDSPGSGLRLVELEEEFQLCTKEELSGRIREALDWKRSTPLSVAAFEVLAVIAYNQPVTRSFVEQVRGVDSSQIVTALAEKGLIEEAGRLELPGRPLAYRTTPLFLRSFGMQSIEELPPLPEEESPA